MINDELKNLVNELGGAVIVENDQPKFIVLTYGKFKVFIHKNVDNPGNLTNNEDDLVEKLNKEILALKAEVAEKEKEISNKETINFE